MLRELLDVVILLDVVAFVSQEILLVGVRDSLHQQQRIFVGLLIEDVEQTEIGVIVVQMRYQILDLVSLAYLGDIHNILSP